MGRLSSRCDPRSPRCDPRSPYRGPRSSTFAAILDLNRISQPRSSISYRDPRHDLLER